MKEFTITEDFPKSEIEFDMRFSNPNFCYDYPYNVTYDVLYLIFYTWRAILRNNTLT